MTLTPEQITAATNYWKQFRKLPIGNAEMIMHLATFAEQVKTEAIQTPPVVSMPTDEEIAVELVARFSSNSRGNTIAKKAFTDAVLWVTERQSKAASEGESNECAGCGRHVNHCVCP